MAMKLIGEQVTTMSEDGTEYLVSERLHTWTVVLNADNAEGTIYKAVHALELLLTDGGALVFRTEEKWPVMVYAPGSWFRVFPGDEDPDFAETLRHEHQLLQIGHNRAQAVVRGDA